MKTLLILLLMLYSLSIVAQVQNYELITLTYFDSTSREVDKAEGYLRINREDSVITFELRDYYNDILYVLHMQRLHIGDLNGRKYERFSTITKKPKIQALIFYNNEKYLYDFTLFDKDRAYRWFLKFSNKKLE